MAKVFFYHKGPAVFVRVIGKVYCTRMGRYIKSQFTVPENDGILPDIVKRLPLFRGVPEVSMTSLLYDQCDIYLSPGQ